MIILDWQTVISLSLKLFFLKKVTTQYLFLEGGREELYE